MHYAKSNEIWGFIYILVSIISMLLAWLIFELTGFSLLEWLKGLFS